MKLYAICWQDDMEPWGWAPATDEDAPPQTFFWDRAEADAALEQHVDALVPTAVEYANEAHRRQLQRIDDRTATGGVRVVRTDWTVEQQEEARVAQRAAQIAAEEPPAESAVRAGVARSWSVQEYDVPVPPYMQPVGEARGAVSDVINPDGSPVLIEALYMRYQVPGLYEADSVDEALSMLEGGEDLGGHSGVGVLVDGQPRFWFGGSRSGRMSVPTPDQRAELMRLYAAARG